MSRNSAPSPLPRRPAHQHHSINDRVVSQLKVTEQDSSPPIIKPSRKPLLRMEIRDLSSKGSHAFLRLIHASTALEEAVGHVLMHLYTGMDPAHIPPTRSITLVLRDMDGVAYTTGQEIDDDHKEIHLSTMYVSKVPESRQKEEILGVLIHEMVHCWQHNSHGTAPGGLIEGIADWVRLKANRAPPHWSDCLDGNGKWDDGYERTAYFLTWLEKNHGEDVVRKINDCLRRDEYREKELWHDCCGKSVQELWDEYQCRFQEKHS